MPGESGEGPSQPAPGTKERWLIALGVLVALVMGSAAWLLVQTVVKPRAIRRTAAARRAASIAQLTIIEGELDKYTIDNGRLPTTQEGLEALVRKPAGARNWRGPYLRDAILPKDAWGHDYQYKRPGDEHRAYDLWSTGADSQLGGEGENADIKSWDPESKKG